MKKIGFFIGLMVVSSGVLAQRNVAKTDLKDLLDGRRSWDTHLSMGYQMPSGDIGSTFGNNLNAGLGFERLDWKNGLILGINGNYMFGNNVKLDPLRGLRTAEGELLAEGSYAEVVLRQRGFFAGAHVGKLFKLHQNGRRIGGLRVVLGGGFFQHWIRIQDNQNASAPQVGGLLRNGYDRLTNGVGVSQFLGYQMMSFNRGINFFAGFEAVEGFTKNRRVYNFDTRMVDDGAKKDFLVGFRLGWIIVIRMDRNASKIEY